LAPDLRDLVQWRLTELREVRRLSSTDETVVWLEGWEVELTEWVHQVRRVILAERLSVRR
jgi:hypothetical protein